MHVDLSKIQPGAYAVIRDIVPWGVMKVAQRYGGKAKNNALTNEDAEVFTEVVFKKMITEWSIKGEDGNLISKPASELTSEEIDALDWRIVNKIIEASEKVLTVVDENVDPN